MLKQPDIVVCRGTNHTWTNRGNEPVKLFCRYRANSKVIETEDGGRLEKTPAPPIFDPPES